MLFNGLLNVQMMHFPDNHIHLENGGSEWISRHPRKIKWLKRWIKTLRKRQLILKFSMYYLSRELQDASETNEQGHNWLLLNLLKQIWNLTKQMWKPFLKYLRTTDYRSDWPFPPVSYLSAFIRPWWFTWGYMKKKR